MEEQEDRMKWSLEEMVRFNHIRNDLDAYLFEVAMYGLGKRDSQPNPRDFGI